MNAAQHDTTSHLRRGRERAGHGRPGADGGASARRDIAAPSPKAITAQSPPARGVRPSRAKTATPRPAGVAPSSAAKKATPPSAGTATSSPARSDVDVQAAAVGRRGAVVVGEEGAAAVGRYGGVVVGDRYESYDAWKAVAAVGAGIAIGTMLAKPPAAATTVVVTGSTYYYHDNVYYTTRDEQRRRSCTRSSSRPPARSSRRSRQAAPACTSATRRTRSVARRITRGCRTAIRWSCCSDATAWRATASRRAARSPSRALQVTLARTAGLSPWKGGGFGMFSTTDDAGRRHVRVFVSAPERSEEIAIAAVARGCRARVRRCCPPTPSSRGWRARVVERERRISPPGRHRAHRDVAHRVRARHAGGDLASDARFHLPCGRDCCAPPVTRTASPTPSSR